jgi:hypothetical protein
MSETETWSDGGVPASAVPGDERESNLAGKTIAHTSSTIMEFRTHLCIELTSST